MPPAEAKDSQPSQHYLCTFTRITPKPCIKKGFVHVTGDETADIF